MKKLLVLALVMGVASLASAGLMYQVDGVNYAAGATINKVGTFTVTIVNVDAPITTLPSIGGVTTSGSFVAGSAQLHGANLPGTWGADDTYINDYKIYSLYIATPAADSLKVGPLFAFNVTVAQGDSFSMVDEMWAESADLGAVTFVPEPATMVLLGLGAMALRRRK